MEPPIKSFVVAHILAARCREHVSTASGVALLHEVRFTHLEYVLRFDKSILLCLSDYSIIATTRAGAALARLILSGKHATLNPVDGTLSKLTSRSMCE